MSRGEPLGRRRPAVADSTKEDVGLGLDRDLGDQPGTETGDVLDNLGQLALAVEQGIDLTTGTVGGRYSCRHGRSPSFAELVALEGTYVRRHLHQGWDATVVNTGRTVATVAGLSL